MIRQSFTVVLERNITWSGTVATEPYEAAWASEAIFFVRVLAMAGSATTAGCNVQISPDGLHWADEGSVLELPARADAVSFVRVGHFGGWLRLAGALSDGYSATLMVYLVLKS